ncbi:MAG: YiiX/YebB-like N1pC/P60 family cysteine hydrolase [bacterium]
MKKNIFIANFFLTTFIFLMLGYAGMEIEDRELSDTMDKDIQTVMVSRQAMADIISYMHNTPDLFGPVKLEKNVSLNREQRLKAWHVWQAFLDHVLAMDSIGMNYSKIYKESKGERKKETFRISFAAFLAQYRYAMDFITIIEQNPDFHVVLNEPVPEIGLPKGTYARLKFRFLNVIRGAEFACLNAVYKFYGQDKDLILTRGMEEDISAIWDAGKGRGPLQTAQNGIRILQDSAFTAWFPVQKGVSNFMSKIRVRRGDEFLITLEQIHNIIPELEPGDILLQRREWCLTNIGLPGFWTHAALYIGTAEERKKYFDDPEVVQWIHLYERSSKDIEELLKAKYPETYAKSLEPQENGHMIRVIEAKGEGVIFTTLEFSAYADSLAVLRPKLSKKTKALAIYRAFHFHGRPYDFNFDFLTDAALVCSELVYKSYLPEKNDEGLTLPLSEVLGRKVLSPNNIARLFDEEYDSNPQLDIVLFLDGDEKTNKARRADVEAFKKSWTRPKWHIIIKDTLLDQTKVKEG